MRMPLPLTQKSAVIKHRQIPQVALWALLLLLFACGSETAVSPTPPAAANIPFTLPEGLMAEQLPYQFDRPTQFVQQDNLLWVAQLNGGENDAQGQVLRLNLDTGEQTVMLEALDKPTGLAVLDETIYVATRDELLAAPIANPADVTVLLSDLPNNGRSNGTLTVTPNGNLLYETSGSRRIPESGRLWEYDVATGESRELARGLKGAYAHVFDENGRLFTTEIADGSIGDVKLPGEINLVVEGADFGWFRCYGRELTGPDCTNVRPAITILPTNSTPTGIAISPFAADTLLVALWVTGEVVQIPLSFSGDNATGEPQPFISGLERPQHLQTLPDGTLLLSDYGTGYLYKIREQ